STRYVEGEVPGSKSALMSFRSSGKQFADSVKSLDVGHRIRTGRTASRRLIHQHDFINEFVAGDLAFQGLPDPCLSLSWRERVGVLTFSIDRIQSSIQHIVQQRGLARSR